MRKKRLIIRCIIAFCIVLLIPFLGGQYMLDYSLKPDNRGRDLDSSWQYMFEEYPYLSFWKDSLEKAGALKDTFIYSPDGVKLHSYFVPASDETKKTALIVHGYTDNAIRMMMIGYMYNKKLGFNILLPDLRNSGLSGGNSIQMGWLDRIDVRQWMDVTNSMFGDSTKMVLHGISMGAATVMMESGDPQPKYVKCFVEDCGYTSVWDEFKLQLNDEFGLPSFPILDAANMLCQMEYGWNFKEASALNQVAKCKLPMFFIHGDGDTYVPTSMVYKLYETKAAPKDLWIVPGAKHAMSYYDYTEEYTKKVKTFVDKYIR